MFVYNLADVMWWLLSKASLYSYSIRDTVYGSWPVCDILCRRLVLHSLLHTRNKKLKYSLDRTGLN